MVNIIITFRLFFMFAYPDWSVEESFDYKDSQKPSILIFKESKIKHIYKPKIPMGLKRFHQLKIGKKFRVISVWVKDSKAIEYKVLIPTKTKLLNLCTVTSLSEEISYKVVDETIYLFSSYSGGKKNKWVACGK